MMNESKATAPPGPDRFLLTIVVGAILLIVVGVATVLLSARRAPVPVDPGSPVGVVQAYAEAVRAGDLSRAYSHLSRGAQASVPLSTYRERFSRYSESNRTDRRVVMEAIDVSEDRAEVKVTTSQFSARADPFSTRTSHRDVTVRLVKEEGVWRIDHPLEPYAFW